MRIGDDNNSQLQLVNYERSLDLLVVLDYLVKLGQFGFLILIELFHD